MRRRGVALGAPGRAWAAGRVIPTAHEPVGELRLRRAALDRGEGGHQGLAAWV